MVSWLFVSFLSVGVWFGFGLEPAFFSLSSVGGRRARERGETERESKLQKMLLLDGNSGPRTAR